MIELLLDLILTHDLLGKAVVHSEDMVDNLYGSNGETQNSLGKNFVRLGTVSRLEWLVSREKYRSNHLSDTKDFGMLNHKKDMFTYFLTFFVDRPIESIHGYQAC